MPQPIRQDCQIFVRATTHRHRREAVCIIFNIIIKSYLNHSKVSDVAGHRIIAFVEVVPAIVEPKHIGVTDSEAEEIVEDTHAEECLVVHPVRDEVVPCSHLRGIHFHLGGKAIMLCWHLNCLNCFPLMSGC